jgi:hypothetical protein
MINGNFTGRESKTETLKDVDEDTFSRFCEFAYKGDYCPPVFEFEEDEVIEAGSDVHVNGDINSDAIPTPPEVDPPAEEAAADPPAEEAAADPPAEEAAADPPAEAPAAEAYYGEEAPADPPPPEAPDGWGLGSTNPKRKKGKGRAYFGQPSKRASFRQEFLEREYSTTQSIDATIEACKPVRNKSHNENYLPVFLGHAKLYVFADKYNIQPLRLLALKKLHQTLTIFNLYAERVGDIVGLVKFTYENTVERVVTEELRDLVVGYVVSELEKISGEEFDHLIREGGDFVVDFWHKVKDDILES